MLKGKSLVELATELQRQAEAKRDFVAETSHLELSTDAKSLSINDNPMPLTDHTHQQIAARLKIPNQFYQRMRESHPDLISNTVNELFHREPETRMIRTLDNTARAFLSNRYKRIDNDVIAEAAFQALQASNQELQIASTEITDTKMYIKCLFPRIEGDVKVNDIVQSGVIISNSEIGMGQLAIKPLIFRLVCTNGLALPVNSKQSGMKKKHLGQRIDATPDFVHIQSDTIAAELKAIQLNIRDTIKTISSKEFFQQALETMQRSTNTKEIVDPIATLENLSKQFLLSKDESTSILTNLIKGADLTQWGMVNAITAHANENPSYNRACDLEEIGGQLLTLNPSQWDKIATQTAA